MSLYSVVKGCWKAVVPQQVRHAIFEHSPKPLQRMRRGFIGKLEKGAAHDEIYDADYYASLVDPTMQVSAEAIASSIVAQFAPRTLVDVGCGTGALMQVLRAKGVTCKGYEYSEAAIATCRKRGLDVTQFNIEKDPVPTGVRVDVVVSTEVAEHLPESCAERFLDVLTAMSDTIVLTAAQPGSDISSTDHVNEQPMAYWIAKMEARGYTCTREVCDRWRGEWEKAGVAGCFYSSVMTFVKPAAAVLSGAQAVRHSSFGTRKEAESGRARVGG